MRPPPPLSKNDNKIQVSDFHKHLQSNGCDHTKNMKKTARDLTSTQQHQQTSSTPITLISSQPDVPLTQDLVSPINTQTTAHIDSQTL